jgi:hypothetical protein
MITREKTSINLVKCILCVFGKIIFRHSQFNSICKVIGSGLKGLGSLPGRNRCFSSLLNLIWGLHKVLSDLYLVVVFPKV